MMQKRYRQAMNADIKVGDILENYIMEQVATKLEIK